jgi:hypothetical protein
MNINTKHPGKNDIVIVVDEFLDFSDEEPIARQTEGVATVQEKLEEVGDLRIINTANTIQSLDTAPYEREFLGFSNGDSSEDDSYMNEDEDDQKNSNKAADVEKPLPKRYAAALAIHKKCSQLKSDAFFSIATNFNIKKNDFSYIMDIQQERFLPLQAAKAMTIGNTTYYSHKQALAFYMIAINPAVPAQFRYEAACKIDGGDGHDRAYGSEKMDAFEKLAADATAATEYRIDSLRALKNYGIADDRLAPITESIAESWDYQANTEDQWRLFEDLYKLDEEEDNEYPYEDPDAEQVPQKSVIQPLQLKIIDIILNKTHLDKDFRTKVAQEKLKGHACQEQILENIKNGQAISLSMAEQNTKSAYNM